MEMLKEAGKMIVEGASGAVLGSICESFLKSIEKCCTFDLPVLESVKSTVEDLKEVIPKLEEHNMELGDREDEVKELKQEMERGTRFFDRLSGVNNLSLFEQSSYNDQLDELDASLKSLVRKLRLQSAVDVKEVLVLEKENAKVVKEVLVLEKENAKVVKEVLVSEKENAEVVKSAKRKVDEVGEACENIQRGQELIVTGHELIVNMIKKQKIYGSARQAAEVLFEGAALVDTLEELYDMAMQQQQAVQKEKDWSLFGKWIDEELNRIKLRTHKILGFVERKTAENEEMICMSASELNHFRMSIEDGVTLLQSCPTILEWTDELKSEYTNRFRTLESTLEVLYNRLDRIRPLKLRCGKCDKSLGAAATSTSLVDPVNC